MRLTYLGKTTVKTYTTAAREPSIYGKDIKEFREGLKLIGGSKGFPTRGKEG